MNDLREAAEKLIKEWDWECGEHQNKALAELIEALRQALAQPEQKPVAIVNEGMGGIEWLYKPLPDDTLLYAAPPKREWVGLTQDDKNELFNNWWNKNQSFPFTLNKLIEDTEEKLMEKNNG